MSGLKTQLDTTRSQLQRQLASLVQEGSELDARAAWTISAPQAGTVSALSAVVGQSATAGSTLISLVPTGRDATVSSQLVAHLYAPSHSTGFVTEGQSVWLRYAAFPYQKFGMQSGRVTAVSRTPINPQDLPPGQAQALMQAVGSNEPMYRITVSLEKQSVVAYGIEQSLQVGMALDAHIQQERRAIWEWMFAPIFSITNNQ